MAKIVLWVYVFTAILINSTLQYYNSRLLFYNRISHIKIQFLNVLFLLTQIQNYLIKLGNHYWQAKSCSLQKSDGWDID